MVMWPFTSATQQALYICSFLSGVACIAAGAHFSYKNVEPQRARAQARKEYVLSRLKKLRED